MHMHTSAHLCMNNAPMFKCTHMLACTQKLQAQTRERKTEPAAGAGAEVGPTLSLNKFNLNTATHMRIYRFHNGIIVRAPRRDCVA